MQPYRRTQLTHDRASRSITTLTSSIATRLSRRRLLTGIAVVTGAGLAAACSGSANKSSNGGSAGSGGAPVTPSGTAAGGVVGASAPTAAPGGASQAGATATAGAPQAANVPKGGTLTLSQVGTDAKSFHPYLTTDTASSSYQGYVFGGSLTEYDPNTLDLVPFAAQKWTLSDDKKTITFTLKDTKWSDGTPLTTDDYVWSYQQAIKPENKYPYAENLAPIVSYTAVDAKTLQVTLKDALVSGVETADSITPLPRHVWEKYDWSDPTKNPEILNPTVGSGAWKLKEWKNGDHATFVANDLYFEGRPNIDTVVVRLFGTQTLAYESLKAGEVDVSSFAQSDYAGAKKLANITVYDYYIARGSWDFLGFNLRRPALQDVRVRHAIAYATDRKGIIDNVLYGLARPTYSTFPQSSWAYTANVEHYDYDPKQAQDLLSQAGYILNGSKKMVKDGQQLSLKLLYNTGNKAREGIATVEQQALQDLGLAVDVQALEFQAYLQQLQTAPFDYDMYVLGWSGTPNPYFSYQIWSQKSIPSLNAGAYVNQQVEDLFEQSNHEFDPEKRKAIFAQIQQTITGDSPYVFIDEGQGYAGVNKKVGGITPTRRGITYNLHQWYINK